MQSRGQVRDQHEPQRVQPRGRVGAGARGLRTEEARGIAAGLAAQLNKDRKKAALKRNPKFEERLRALGPEIYEKLDTALESVISKLSKNEDEETVDEIVDLIIHYYESDTLRIILETVRDSAPEEVERLSRLLAQYGAARVGEVTEILHSQLEVIELLREKVADGVLEKEIHKIIAENIWLVRNGLTYWFDNKAFATTLGEKLSKKFTFASGKRPDLACYDDRTLHNLGNRRSVSSSSSSSGQASRSAATSCSR